MATDLDRAYVINGDDLRIALNGMNGRWASVANPRTMAGDILDAIARPAGTAGIRVTESSLAGALEGFYVRVRSTTGAMGTSRAQIADADETAKALLATLSRMAALREDDNDVVDAEIHCSDCPGADRELRAMATALAALNANDWRTAIRALHHLNVHELARAFRWLADRFPALDELPF